MAENLFHFPILISDEVAKTGRLYRDSGGLFQTNIANACWADGTTSCAWCLCQFIPLTSPCTQYFLRKKVLDNDMSKYVCFQGHFNFCCGLIGPNKCGEKSCPDLCLCCEAICCNGLAVSASRMTVMDQYDLRSDPCDNRLIRFNNCLQMVSTVFGRTIK